MRIVDRGHDQILQHLDVLFRDDFRIDLQRLHLLGAIDDNGDHAAAGVAFDLELGHLLLQAGLHLLRLLPHLLNVYRLSLSIRTMPGCLVPIHISSTSRISAGKTSSSACTPASASACSRSVDFLASPALTAGPLASCP